ncbi:M23 family metallopeptidase [Epibacterium ulvae]|uniref:M23 family metallopeptidase n=1 Tax=Epibacterium ulvae TaxID=1156985 RepID=UPI001BFC9F23|nr:M23 family metallopeptidase [Epibacterium ulvae]MBT8154289.1 M23 family metallopeptidase [Epibacterium ulvae]
MKYALALACAASLASPLGASDFSLAWPVDCTLGQDCHIQQYVDHDPGPGSQDFLCQGLSYDGHKGTDIALPTHAEMHAGMTVLAAAAGTVTGVRNTMADVLYSSETADAIKGRECGNGVVIKHADGWETQYCHLKQDSVLVKSGQTVTPGTPLGEIGLSGQTQFPHLHLSVRHNNQVVDPFTSASPDPSTCRAASDTLWGFDVAYEPGGLLATGFSDTVPDYSAVKAGTAAQTALPAAAQALVFWGYAYGGRTGDKLHLSISGPDGPFVTHTEELPKAQAQFYRAAGRRLRTAGWPKGTYTGTARLLRDGAVVDVMTTRLTIK